MQAGIESLRQDSSRSMDEPTENEGMDQEVKLLPILSGFRDKDTLGAILEFAFYNAWCQQTHS